MQQELNNFMQKLSPSLKFRVLSHIFSGSLASNKVIRKFLKDVDDTATYESSKKLIRLSTDLDNLRKKVRK